jgi:hypothetical protein
VGSLAQAWRRIPMCVGAENDPIKHGRATQRKPRIH